MQIQWPRGAQSEQHVLEQRLRKCRLGKAECVMRIEQRWCQHNGGFDAGIVQEKAQDGLGNIQTEALLKSEVNL